MILNLAPERKYHQETLSSLNFANRTKRIEVRESENEPAFKGCTRAVPTFSSTSLQRQPLKPLGSFIYNSAVRPLNPPNKQGDTQGRAFSVYSDTARLPNAAYMETLRQSPLKRPSDLLSSCSRPTKRWNPDLVLLKAQPTISQKAIERIVEDKIANIFTARALAQPATASLPDFSKEVQKRLEDLEKKIDGKDGGREQGLTFLFMAKQHALRGDDSSALRMFTLAKDYFPDNQKLDLKIERLRKRVHQRMFKKQRNEPRIAILESDPERDKCLVYSDFSRPKESSSDIQEGWANAQLGTESSKLDTTTKKSEVTRDNSNYETEIHAKDKGYESDGSFHYKAKTEKDGGMSRNVYEEVHTPRTRRLLDIVNTREVS